MINEHTLEQCKKNLRICQLKIKNLEHGIKQLELIIAESLMDEDSLNFLRKKSAESRQDLEILYLLINND